MKTLFTILVLLSIVMGLALELRAQKVVTLDSVQKKLRTIPKEVFKQLEEGRSPKRQQKNVEKTTENGNIYTIPAASENNVINLTIANATKRSIENISVTVEGIPKWLRLKNSRENVEELSAGDITEVSFSFDLASEVAPNRKADITFNVTGSGGFASQKNIQVVSDKPLTFKLNQNYPNPFNPSTNISYRLPKQMRVKVTVYNILGRKVAVLADELQKAGEQTLRWDASRYASGVYFYRIIAEGNNGQQIVRSKKMLLIK